MPPIFRVLSIALLVFSGSSVGQGHAQEETINQADLIAGISAQLTKADVVRGEFVQNRFLKVLSRPLTSKGSFVYRRDLGVRWQVVTPFPSVIYITPAGVNFQGERSQAVTESFGQLLLALLTVDLVQLNKHFQLSAQLHNEPLQQEHLQKKQWTLTLIPRSSQWQQAIDKISVQGMQAVNSIEVFERDGDRIVVDIASVRYQPALNEREQKGLSDVLQNLRSGND